jgi:hypothetical protein
MAGSDRQRGPALVGVPRVDAVVRRTSPAGDREQPLRARDVEIDRPRAA